MTDPPLFAADYQEPPDTSTQVDRVPGTPDAPCLCWPTGIRLPLSPACSWPWCKPPTKGEE